MKAPARILVATDGSILARRAAAFAVALAQPLGASIVAFHAGSHRYVPYSGEVIPPRALTPARIAAGAKQRGETCLAQVAAAGAKAGVAVRGIYVVHERPAEAIVRAARDERCDLIVLGSHGRRSLRQLLLGSVANHVLVRAQLPVVLVR